jgi:hypothetical protein
MDTKEEQTPTERPAAAAASSPVLPAVDQAAPPVSPVIPPPMSTPRDEQLAELQARLVQLELFVQGLNRIMIEMQNALNGQADALQYAVSGVDAHETALRALAERQPAIAHSTAPAPAPVVIREPARAIAPGQAPVPGGPVLRPLVPAPSLAPGALPPLQPAPSLGGGPTAPQAPRSGWLPPPTELAIPIDDKLTEGTHFVKGPNGEDIELRVKRPGMGGLAGQRPSGGFRRMS